MNKVMKQVIRLEEKKKKPIELTHMMLHNGWQKDNGIFDTIDKIVYLGKCDTDGDLFAVYENGDITICKGHLNDGVY